MLDYRDPCKKILWHGSALGAEQRLRFVSFVAERFWYMAFSMHLGLNQLKAEDVDSVVLSNVKVNGHHFDNKTFKVPEADGAMALRIAIAVVELLEGLRYRVLDAVVPFRGSEHDLVAEKKGLPMRSSIEVVCRTIKKPSELLEDSRTQLRKKALKLWCPKTFSERLAVMVEFSGAGPLEHGWRALRCEAYSSRGEWTPLRGWGGAMDSYVEQKSTATKVQRSATPGSSAKRRRTTGTVGDASDKFVLIDGAKYTTLPWFLGKSPVKSQKAAAAQSAADFQVDVRRGDWKTLSKFIGKEILPSTARSAFRLHRWVSTVCPRAERFSAEMLQVRLLSPGQKTSSKVFLWSRAELEKCRSLKD